MAEIPPVNSIDDIEYKLPFDIDIPSIKKCSYCKKDIDFMKDKWIEFCGLLFHKECFKKFINES
jgi:hypothetical protein